MRHSGSRLGLQLLILCVLFFAPVHVSSQGIQTPDASEVENTEDDLFSETDDSDIFGDDTEETEDTERAEEPEPSDPRAADEEVLGSERLDDASDAPDAQAARSPANVPSEGVEEILVTGEAGQGIEADASVSVTSFGADDLAALGVADVSDLAAFTPNLEIRAVGGTSATFFLRGVGLNDFTANATTSVVIYQDDVAQSLPALGLGQLFDVEKVDVLRGPQGSGPGRNASAGAIKIYSRKPTGEFGAQFRTELGWGETGGYMSQDYEGALEAPLLKDMLSARVAFRLKKSEPFGRNGCRTDFPEGRARVTDPTQQPQPGTPIFCDENRTAVDNPDWFPGSPESRFWDISDVPNGLPDEVNDEDSWAVRGLWRFLPPDTDMDFLLNVHGAKLNQLSPLGQPIGTGGSGAQPGFFGGSTFGYRQPEIVKQEEKIFDRLGGNASMDPVERQAIRSQTRTILSRKLAKDLDKRPYRGDYNLVGDERQDSWGVSLRGDLELDSMQLTSIAAYEWYDRTRVSDSDYTPNLIFESDSKDDGWQFSYDLRAEGELEQISGFGWNAGAYYLIEEIDFFRDTPASASLTSLVRQYTQTTQSLGVYSGLVWDLLDEFTLEGGVRLNWDRKDFDVGLTRSTRPVCSDFVINDIVITEGEDCKDGDTWLEPTGTIALTYHYSEEVSVYWKYSRGWKGAQLNAGGAVGDPFTLAEPETIDAFEFGFSGTWFDDRLNFHGTAFWYNYKDYQVFQTQNDEQSPPQRVVLNASDSIIYGAEVDVTVEPIEQLIGVIRFSWLESEFADFTQRQLRTIPPENLMDPPRILPVLVDYTGNSLPNTPRFKVSGTVEYTVDLQRFGSLVPRYDFVWTDDVFFDSSEGRGSTNIQDEIFMPEFAMLHNARLAYRTPGGNIEIAYWIRNITDEVYKTLAFDASVAADLVGNLVGDPRTMGLSFSVQW
jgi:iron complex outermembrane receptor protein